MYRDFAGLDWTQRLPDETTILRFRHLLEAHKLADQMLSVVNDMLGSKGLLLGAGTVVDATLTLTLTLTQLHQERQRLLDSKIDQVEKINTSIRVKVEHPFRVIRRQFGFVKVRYRGMKKNTAQLETLFALSNLWMARNKLMALEGAVRLQTANGV